MDYIKNLLTLIWKWISIYIQKEINMARPREIKLEHGTVYLNGFSAEMANDLSDHIKAFVFQPVLEGTHEVPELPELVLTTTTEVKPCSEKAIGTRVSKLSGKAQFVTVLYNGETKEAYVSEVNDCDGLRDASTRFKIAAGTIGFV